MKNSPYTREQEQWLLKNATNVKDFTTLTKLFNEAFKTNKTNPSIKSRCYKLGIKSNSSHNLFTKEQEQWILDNFDSYKTMIEITEQFNLRFKTNRDYTSIRNFANRHHIQKAPTPKQFSKEQEQWLLKNGGNYYFYEDLQKDFAKKFNDKRTICSLKHKCERLGINLKYYYTKEQKEWIRNNVNNYSIEEITYNFNNLFNTHRSKSTIANHCHKNNLYFSTNKERLSILKSRIFSKPIGYSFVDSNGYTYYKTNNIINNRNANWTRDVDLLYKHKKNEVVIILDHNKPITKENTIVAHRGVIGSMAHNGYHNLPSELKRVAIKSCELNLIINKLKKDT